MPVDMSPEAIERRLQQVSEARKLATSLRDAGKQIRDGSASDRTGARPPEDGNHRRSGRQTGRR